MLIGCIIVLYVIFFFPRALLVKQSAGDGIEMRVPLFLFSEFFGLDIFYPAKRLLNLEFTLNKPGKNLIKPPTDSSDYDIVVSNCYLDISYVTLETSIRSSYYDLIEKEKLIRCISSVREGHFSLPSGSSVYFLHDISPYGVLPEFVTLLILPDSRHFGNFENSYVYSRLDIESIQLFIDGHPCFLNDRLRNLQLNSILSPDVSFFYRNFLLAYGGNSRFITLKTFFTDFFCMSFPLTAMATGTSDGALPLIRSGGLNATITLRSAQSKNYVLIVHSHYKSVVKIDVTGEILES